MRWELKSNVILIGYMGCGKSTIGRGLSQQQNLSFLDTDAWIEEKEGITISQIFAGKGEPYFRDLETECLKELLKEKKCREVTTDFQKKEKGSLEKEMKGYVVSVGGGLPVREENRLLLQQLGQVIYLKAQADTIYERIKGDTTRPLLQTENPLQRIKEMMSVREEKYVAAAHKIIVVDGKSVEAIIEEIKNIM